jgi:hypothetical protein
MNEFERMLLVAVFVIFLLIISCLKLANHSQKDRHRQIWSPLITGAVGLTILFLVVTNRFPNFHPPELILLNLGYLAIYALFKLAVVHIQRTKGANRSDNPHAIARFIFEMHQGSMRLKAEWYYASLVFRHAYYAVVVLLVLYLFCSVLPDLRPYVMVMPDHLAIVLLFLAECSWFLASQPGLQRTIGDREQTTPAHSLAFRALYTEYQRLWSDQILASGCEARGPLLQHATEKSALPARDEELLQGLLKGNHLLVKDGWFSSISTVIFPGIYRLLLQNKKLMLIVDTQQELELGIAWFHQGMKEQGAPAFAWTVASLGQAVAMNEEVHLLVIQASELLKDSLLEYIRVEQEQSSCEFVVLMMEGDRLLSRNGSALRLFSSRFNGQLGAPPQYVVFSTWAEGLGDAMQRILGVVPQDITVHPVRGENIYYTVFAQERGLLQQRIMPRMVHRVLDAEAVLTIPALKLGVDKINLIHGEQFPGKSNGAELLENIDHAVPYYRYPDASMDLIRTGMEWHSYGWGVKASDHAVVICRDTTSNLIHSLGHWLSSGYEHTLVAVVSPPYLLRDYMAANTAFFLHNDRIIAAIVPIPAWHRKSAYQQLMDQLSHSFLSEERLQVYLRAAGIEECSTWEGIRRYRELQGDTNAHREILEAQWVRRFDAAEGRYVEKLYYRLHPEEAERIKQSAAPYYSVELQSGIALSQLLGDHLYQMYLPGQITTFEGTPYRIKRIDAQLKRVEVSLETLTGPHIYKQSRTYALRKDSVSQPSGDPIRLMIDRFEFTFRTEFRSFDVYTNGYYDFGMGFDLQSDQVVYVPLAEEDQGYYRPYPQGNLLTLTINSLDGQFAQPDRLAFTLSYLLNELFVSLYPHNHAYMSVCTALPESFFVGQHDPVRERLGKYVPRLRTPSSAADVNTSESIRLFIFEDSTHHLGLLDSVVQYWNHFMEIIDDYLYWAFDEDGKAAGNNHYLCHGRIVPHKLFSFQELAAIIRRWLPETTLRQARTRHQEKHAEAKTDKPELGELKTALSHSTAISHIQEDLAVAMPGRSASFGTPPRNSVVTTKEQLQAVYHEVRDYMVQELGLKGRERVGLALVTAVDTQASKSYEGSVHIQLVKGMSRDKALAALAHELTRIWQHDHLQLEVIPREELEGLAMWMAIRVLERFNYLPEAERLREGLLDRNDIYGRGFRALLVQLEAESELSNPFSFMLIRYGRVAV